MQVLWHSGCKSNSTCCGMANCCRSRHCCSCKAHSQLGCRPLTTPPSPVHKVVASSACHTICTHCRHVYTASTATSPAAAPAGAGLGDHAQALLRVAGHCSAGELSCLQEILKQLFLEEEQGKAPAGQPRLSDLATMVLVLTTEAYRRHVKGGWLGWWGAVQWALACC
jgi:hypothetical protein